MAEAKTKPTRASVSKFLHSIEPEQKRKDGLALLKLYKKITGKQAVMWGPSIVGFGKYHLASGDWPLAGFSPRKQTLTLYVMEGNHDSEELFEKLGKHSTSVACLYIKRLADVDMKVLEALIRKSYRYSKKRYR